MDITKDFDDFEKVLQNSPSIFTDVGSGLVAYTLEAIKEIISPYPAQPDRNRAKTFNTYVRGIGNYPKSAFTGNAGAPGGFNIKPRKQIKKGKIKLTSQQMSKRFQMSVKISGNDIEGTLVNNATYSGFVLGPKEGDPHQASFHAETGWENADDAVDKAWKLVDGEVDKVMMTFIDRLSKN